MIYVNSPCYLNLKVGDAVRVKLLPLSSSKAFELPDEILTLPVVGFNYIKFPIIGTIRKDLYDRHHFNHMYLYTAGGVANQWKYGMSLGGHNIEIHRIIKGAALWLHPNLFYSHRTK